MIIKYKKVITVIDQDGARRDIDELFNGWHTDVNVHIERVVDIKATMDGKSVSINGEALIRIFAVMSKAGKKIEAIKLARKLFDIGLLEAKSIVEASESSVEGEG